MFDSNSSCQALWPLSAAPAGGSCLWRPYCLRRCGWCSLGHHSAALSFPSPQVSPFTINRSLFGDKSCLFGLSPPPLSPGHSPFSDKLCHLWEEGRKGLTQSTPPPINPTLTKGLYGRKPLMVAEACGQPPNPGLHIASLTCDTILTRQEDI